MSLLDNFFAYVEEHPVATNNLSLESTMALWSRHHKLLVDEAVDFGWDIISLFAAGFASFALQNEGIPLEELFVEFTGNYLLSDQMAEQLANTIADASDADEEADDIVQIDAPDDEEAHERRMRNFLAKLLSNVPSSFEPYFGVLNQFGKKDYLGNDWCGSVKVFDRKKNGFGHDLADQERQARVRGFPSVHNSDAVTAALSEDYLSQPPGKEGDPGSGWLDASLATAGHYGDTIPNDTASKNVQGLKGEGTKEFKHAVSMPHAAVSHAQAFARLNNFAIRHAGVKGHFATIMTEHGNEADAIANHVGELFGRLTVSRATIEPTKAAETLYKKSDLAQGLEKKPTVKQKRVVEQALGLMEKSNRPNTWNPVAQGTADRIAAEQSQYKHPDGDALGDEPILR